MKDKTNIPIWTWIVIIILAGATFLLFVELIYNSTPLEDYALCVENSYNTTLEYGSLGQDYIQLLECYTEGLPTCEPLNEKYGNTRFTQKK